MYLKTTENKNWYIEHHKCGCFECCSKHDDYTRFNFCPEHHHEYNEKSAQLRAKFIYEIKNGVESKKC